MKKLNKEKTAGMKSQRLLWIMSFIMAVMAVFILDPFKMRKIHLCAYVLVGGLAVVNLIIIAAEKMDIGTLVRWDIMVGIIFSMTFFFVNGWHNHFEIEGYYKNLKPHRKVTILQRAEEKLRNDLFPLYYFKNKNISVLCSDESQELLAQAELDYSGRDMEIRLYPKYETTQNIDILGKKCLSAARYEYGNYVFVVDQYWKECDTLICFEYDGQSYMCSEWFYNDFGREDYSAVETDNQIAINTLAEYSIREKGGAAIQRYKIIQILAVFMLIMIGMIIMIGFWGNDYLPLSVCLSLPTGAVIWTIFGIFNLLLKIKFSLISQGVSIAIFLLIYVFLHKESYRSVSIRRFFLYCFILCSVVVFYALYCYTYTSTDSIRKGQYGLMLASQGHPENYFTKMSSFGLIEPFIHSIGYMMGADYLYAFYPVIFCSIMFFLGISFYYFLRIKNYKWKAVIPGVCVLLTGAIIIFYTFDFRWGIYYVMSHNLISLYILCITVLLVLKKEYDLKYFEEIFFLASAAITMTRVEGAIYVFFFIITALGFLCTKEMRRAAVFSSGMIIAWSLLQLLFYSSEGTDTHFFTPGKVMILCGGAVFIILFCSLYEKIMNISFVLKNYFYILIVSTILLITAISLTIGRELAMRNYRIYISHLSSYMEELCNSGGLWMFVFLLLIGLWVVHSELSLYAGATILGYLGVVFLIFLFREDLPMREGMGDSARRVLVQIMPAAIWLLAAGLTYETEDV